MTPEEAAEILNIGVASVYALASAGTITRQTPRWGRGQAYDLNEVEQRSLARLGYHDHGHPYWLNVAEVADYLGVTVSRVRQLLDAEQIPSATAPNGRRYVRRPSRR